MRIPQTKVCYIFEFLKVYYMRTTKLKLNKLTNFDVNFLVIKTLHARSQSLFDFKIGQSKLCSPRQVFLITKS